VTEVVNLRDVPAGEEIDRDGFRSRLVSIRTLLGGEQLGCSVYDVPPGERLWPYHYHLGNEEWLVVVTGRPMLRVPAGERELAPGVVVAFPEGEAGAHTLANRTDESARVAIFSTLRRGSVVYPDSEKMGANRRYFRLAEAVDYWDGEKP
jgi:uncharacterized cupin superfamily protein